MKNKEEIPNFAELLLINKTALFYQLNKIHPSLNTEITEIITKTCRENQEYKYLLLLSIIDIKHFKQASYKFKKIILDKCAPLIHDACIKHLEIDFDLLPNKNIIISTINMFVDTLFLYNVYMLKKELKENNIENDNKRLKHSIILDIIWFIILCISFFYIAYITLSEYRP